MDQRLVFRMVQPLIVLVHNMMNEWVYEAMRTVLCIDSFRQKMYVLFCEKGYDHIDCDTKLYSGW